MRTILFSDFLLTTPKNTAQGVWDSWMFQTKMKSMTVGSNQKMKDRAEEIWIPKVTGTFSFSE